MKRTIIAVVALASIISSVCLPMIANAQKRVPGDSRRAALDEIARLPPVPLPAGTLVKRDLAYGSDPAQRLDIYLPAKADKAPILVMVHGGGWYRGDKGNNGVVGNKVAHWVPKGYIVVSINYRLVPAATPREQADDVAKALHYVQTEAGKWGGDPARVVLMGHSAGAHLVALLAAEPSIATRVGVKPWVGVVALDSAAYDVTKVMSSPHFDLYDQAFGRDQALWRAASPALNIELSPGHALLVCSTRRAESCAMADDFAAKYQTKGGRVVIVREDMTHGEINALLGASGPYTDQIDKFLASLGLS
jgi:acetyl esterase/lipase